MIVRGPRPERYVVLDNDIVRNHALSFKARGILAYLLSMPDNWSCSSKHLATVGPDGRDAVRTGLLELQTAGYLVRQRQQDKTTGRWSTITIVHDQPVDRYVDNHAGLSTAEDGLPDAGESGPLRTTYEVVPTRQTADIVTERRPTLCTSCKGAGWTAWGDDVERCACNPKVVEL